MFLIKKNLHIPGPSAITQSFKRLSDKFIPTSNNVASVIFNMFKKPSQKYPKNFSHNNFSLKKCSLNSTKYSISFRGPKLWNEFLNTDEKLISSYNLFSRKIKSKLLDTENELRYF